MKDVEYGANIYQNVVVPLSWLEEKMKALGRAEDQMQDLKDKLAEVNNELLLAKKEMSSMDLQIRILQREAEKEYGIG